jgi:hypothetical protein
MIVCAAVAAAGVAALLAGAASDHRWTAFSTDVPPSGAVAGLAPDQQICQGPLPASVGFGEVRTWIAPITAPGAMLEVRVKNAGGDVVASGRSTRGYGKSFAPTASLNATVPASSQISVCVANVGPRRVLLLGAGVGAGSQVAFLFLRRHPASLLSLVPSVLRRAALFRPSWLGPWTFWLLTAGLLLGFVIGAIAVAKAVQSDSRGDPTR